MTGLSDCAAKSARGALVEIARRLPLARRRLTPESFSKCPQGHDWQPCEIRYEQGTAMAYVGDAAEKTRVGVTWVCDEVCATCGAESWWPA